MAEMLIHIGTGEDRKSYAFDEDKLMNVEAMAMEAATEQPLLKILKGLEAGSMTSFTAVVWIMRRREEPWLQFGDVQFKVAELGAGDDEPAGDAAPKEAGPDEATAPN